MALELRDREHTGMERKEGRKMERFILDGIDRLLVKGAGVITVMRGKVDGALQAIVLGPDCPLELLLGDDRAGESRGFLKRFRDMSNGAVGKVLQAAGLGCVAMAAACGTQPDIENGHNQPSMTDDRENPEPQFGTAKLAMTKEDLLNLGEPQLVPWGGGGEEFPNISKMGDKYVLTSVDGLEYNNGQAEDVMWYIECDDIEKCLKEGVPKPIEGQQEAFQEYTNHEYPDVLTSYWGGIIYKNTDGQYKIRTGSGLLGPVELDIDHTGEGGALKVSNLIMTDPFFDLQSGLTINETPYLIGYDENGGSFLINLHTGEQQPIDLSNQCSAPHVDAGEGWWVGSRWGKYDTCKLIAAPKLEDLGKELGDYMFIESQGVCNNLYNPRISGKVLIWEGSGCSGGGGIFYALVQPYCGDGVPNGNETPQSCPKDFGINPGPDTVQPEPQPDTTTVLPDQDIVAEETGEQIDAVVPPEDTAKPPKPDTVPPIDTNEDAAEPKLDTLLSADTPQDTAVPPKDTVNPKPDTGKDTSKTGDTPQDSESPYDTAQDVVKPKPDTIPQGKDIPLPLPGKDTVQSEKDTGNPEPEEKESGGGGGGGGCSVTW